MSTVEIAPTRGDIDAFGFCTKSLSFSVKNTSGHGLDLAFSVSGTDLTVEPASVHVASGATTSVAVKYRPTTTSASTGTLTVKAGGSTLATADVSCTPKNPLYVDTTLDFGKQIVGQTTRATLSLR